ncbi:MAG: 2-C-methyl-D-erythritol 4-phosphate cytidylyltransferase [Pseudomonadota bacterium]
MTEKLQYWVVIPAAGIGKRFGSDKPKQYLTINNKTILEYTINCFIDRADIAGVVVAIAEQDEYWQTLDISKHNKIMIAAGGKERFHSVCNALHTLSDKTNSNDWILVHDAARPCLKQDAINRLIAELSEHETGGILGLPCRDTMKRSSKDQVINETVERDHLWHAQTPQMFRYKKLLQALLYIEKNNLLVTDEAMALELQNEKVKLVEGHAENIKITQKDDFEQAKLYLKWVT